MATCLVPVAITLVANTFITPPNDSSTIGSAYGRLHNASKGQTHRPVDPDGQGEGYGPCGTHYGHPTVHALGPPPWRRRQPERC